MAANRPPVEPSPPLSTTSSSSATDWEFQAPLVSTLAHMITAIETFASTEQDASGQPITNRVNTVKQ
jgi:hypothetical protein